MERLRDLIPKLLNAVHELLHNSGHRDYKLLIQTRLNKASEVAQKGESVTLKTLGATIIDVLKEQQRILSLEKEHRVSDVYSETRACHLIYQLMTLCCLSICLPSLPFLTSEAMRFVLRANDH